MSWTTKKLTVCRVVQVLLCALSVINERKGCAFTKIFILFNNIQSSPHLLFLADPQAFRVCVLCDCNMNEDKLKEADEGLQTGERTWLVVGKR